MSAKIVFSADKKYAAIYFVYYEIKFTPAWDWATLLEVTANQERADALLAHYKHEEKNPDPSGRDLIRNPYMVIYEPVYTITPFKE
ncbi:MAG: hypothetical protein ACP5N7_05425 [Candidatus Pacearchaeota archaeon]